MATHDYVIDNSTGATVRADINSVLQAILTNNSSSSSPSTTAAYMFWADTTSGTLKIRNSSDNAWVELLQLDGTLTLEDGSASTPGLAFRDDLNTGIYSSGDDRFNIATAGVERMELNTTSTIFNEDGADVDFRIEGDTQANLFYVDAGNDRIAIGHNSPVCALDVRGTGTDFQGIRITNSQHNSGAASSAQLKFAITNSAGERSIRLQCTEMGNDSNDLAMDFYTGGSSSNDSESLAMRINNAGMVMIGTTTEGGVAADNLTIADTGHAGITIRSGTSNVGSLYFSDGTSGDDEFRGAVQYNHTSNYLRFFSDATERMLIDSSGRVAIQGSPTRALLEVRASGGSNTMLTAVFGADEGTTAGTLTDNADKGGRVGLQHYDTDEEPFGLFSYGATNGSNALNFGGGTSLMNAATHIGIYTAATSTTTSGTERIRITSAGNVGIGLTTPDQKLHVYESSGSSQSYIHVQNNRSRNAAIKFTTTQGSWLVGQGIGNDNNRFAIYDNQERFVINSSGLISLGTTTTANARLFVNPNVDGSTQRGITIQGRKDVYDVIAINFVHADGLSSQGSIQYTSTAAVSYNTSSDYRLKQDVVTLTDSITKLKQLNPVHFKWKDMPSVETDGFLAHEVQTIIPSAITGEKDALDENGNIEPQQIDIGKLTPL